VKPTWAKALAERQKNNMMVMSFFTEPVQINILNQNHNIKKILPVRIRFSECFSGFPVIADH